MAQSTITQLPYNEADILLAISAINQNQILSVNRATVTFNVPKTTLRDRRAGKLIQRDYKPKLKKLTKLKEEVIVGYILELDSRGFAPTLGAIRNMADKLLTARAAGQVSKNQPSNFVKRTDSLIIRFNRVYNRQRALYKDPKAIRAWFKLIARTKAIYGICDNNTYNFNETGFIMDKILAQLVITSLERRGRLKAIQLGNYKWVTVIQGINAAGQAIPPFIIFTGKYYLSTQYQEDILYNQAIAVSDNGQIGRAHV